MADTESGFAVKSKRIVSFGLQTPASYEFIDQKYGCLFKNFAKCIYGRYQILEMAILERCNICVSDLDVSM